MTHPSDFEQNVKVTHMCCANSIGFGFPLWPAVFELQSIETIAPNDPNVRLNALRLYVPFICVIPQVPNFTLLQSSQQLRIKG